MTDVSEQLSAFLRSRRERLRPEDVSLPETRRRRTPGLRREEVASLAGISAEWYVKLEQGRAVAPSATTVDALARALRLTDAERWHLAALARGDGGGHWSHEVVPDTVRCLVESLAMPAYVTGLRWDMLVWNAPATELLGDLEALPIEDRNILSFVLTDARGRVLFGEGWADEARRMVALFRPVYDRHSDDPAFARLVEHLRAGCQECEGWRTTHDVDTPVSGTKRLLHPVLGQVDYRYSTFQANDDPRLKLVVYMPAHDKPQG